MKNHESTMARYLICNDPAIDLVVKADGETHLLNINQNINWYKSITFDQHASVALQDLFN